jgi:hypothetical protein
VSEGKKSEREKERERGNREFGNKSEREKVSECALRTGLERQSYNVHVWRQMPKSLSLSLSL